MKKIMANRERWIRTTGLWAPASYHCSIPHQCPGSFPNATGAIKGGLLMTSERWDSNPRLDFTAHASSRSGRRSVARRGGPGWKTVEAAVRFAFGFQNKLYQIFTEHWRTFLNFLKKSFIPHPAAVCGV